MLNIYCLLTRAFLAIIFHAHFINDKYYRKDRERVYQCSDPFSLACYSLSYRKHHQSTIKSTMGRLWKQTIHPFVIPDLCEASP